MYPEEINNVPPNSKRSEPVAIKFQNHTDKVVNIHWINYVGNKVLFGIIGPRSCFVVKTFMSHVWVFTEANNSSDTLLVNKKLYFRPSEFRYISPSPTKMHLVFITNRTVPSLQRMCIRYMSEILKCVDVKYLEIPTTLKKKIIQSIHILDPKLHDSDEKIKCETNLVYENNNIS